MKKSIILGLLGLAVSVAPSFGQGFIVLDNYNSAAHPLITYGVGSGGTVGTGLLAGWTVGLYFAQGDITGSVVADPTGHGDVTLQNAGFAVGSGTGSTAPSFTSAFSTPGEFAASSSFQASGTAGSTVTVEVIAYNGSDYLSSLIRGHSTAFTMTALAGTSFPQAAGDFMPTFDVTPVPEPTTFALAGLGAAALMIFRRKK